MRIAYIDTTGQDTALYGANGKLMHTIKGINGKLCGQGTDFFVVDNGEAWQVVTFQGKILSTHPHNLGKLVKVDKNQITILEDNNFVKYDKYGARGEAIEISKDDENISIWRKYSYLADHFITLLIILNALAAGAMTYLDNDSTLERGLNIFCDISIVIFIIEMVVRISCSKPTSEFFKGEDAGWNIFDLIVTIISSLSFFGGVEGLMGARAIRILRELRLLRVVSGSSDMKRIFHALVYALPQMSWAMLFFVLLYYIYGIMGVELYGTDCEKFATLHQSFLTLMQLMTFDDWMAVTNEVMQTNTWAWIYFISFIFLAAYILLNLLVGIVVDSLNEVRAQESMESCDITREVSKLETQLEIVKTLTLKSSQKENKNKTDKAEK